MSRKADHDRDVRTVYPRRPALLVPLSCLQNSVSQWIVTNEDQYEGGQDELELYPYAAV